MFTVDTARLSIRPLCARDRALYCGLYTDSETMRFIGEPWSPERATRRFLMSIVAAQRPSPRRQVFAMFGKPGERPVGLCGILRIERARRRAEVGIMLRAGARVQGFAKEGMRALITRAFQALEVDTIWVQISADRPIFARKLSELGFVRRTGGEPIRGVRSANCVWSVRRDNWQDTSRSRPPTEAGVTSC